MGSLHKVGPAFANSWEIRCECPCGECAGHPCWVAELLGVAPESVAPDDDLIGQGLDSIRMMTLSGRWRRQAS